jgi:predicted nucleic-acid-binding Zn-ribbon protein
MIKGELAMDNKLVCPKCGSKDVIPNVRLTGGGDAGLVQATVYEKPASVLFKGARNSKLTATVCGQCGHIELFVTNPDKLFAAYRRSEEERPTDTFR